MAVQSKQSGFRVIIAGGGIAGLTLANALQHAGVDYILLESRTEIAPQVGASIGILSNGSRILDQLGCYEGIKEETTPLKWHGDHCSSGEYVSPRSERIQLEGIRYVKCTLAENSD
jgi:2-polyprenyl-6-methoxyphenol hydroxylase-like FAD-dependent oxidoreductase